MNKKYEISVWRDIYSQEENKWIEEKIIVIGSDTMTSQSRAREPKLVSNVNGTNTFSFVMYYSYIDTQTGDKVRNPFIPFLVNERKLKVYWKNKWYDFLIKKIDENSTAHTFTYTCEDQYLTELSRSGFSLEFNSELQNNIGTAEELINKTIENTDWQFDSENSDIIYQTLEEAVYETVVLSSFQAKKEPDLTSRNFFAGDKILVFYSCAPAAKVDALKSKVQFYYTTDDHWEQDENDMLVINGDCYEVDNIQWTINGNEAVAQQAIGLPLFRINFNSGLSRKYRADRYVDSQKSVYSPVAQRYVDVYTKDGKEIYGYSATEFDDALAVVNLITNPSNFQNASGWNKDDDDENGLLFRISPPFDKNTVVATYEAKSYLRICGNRIYTNQGIQNNRSYIKDGFSVGDTYIFRYKCLNDQGGLPEVNGQYVAANIWPSVKTSINGTSYFNVSRITGLVDGWNEYKFTCTTACSYDNLLTIGQRPIIYFTNLEGYDYWIEEIQFFKEVYGEKDGERVRINPDEMDIQAVVSLTYKYFDPEQEATTIDELEFIDGSDAIPVSNNFQRYGTIEESQSNRFNILQTIAETFECWVRFEVLHDENGYMLYDDEGAPCKYVQIKREIGKDSGLTFTYGIDLQGVTRTLKSSSISTKTIVSQNDNQFGQNGFCTIARSTQNYPRENVIYNFDYYIQQGLLDKETIQNDLYGTDGLYDVLHDNNVQYMSNLETLTYKKTDLTRQKAQQKIYNQYLTSANEEKTAIEDDLMKLAGVDNYQDALDYARNHLDNKKVQALINDHTYVVNTIANYRNLYEGITASITSLTEAVENYEQIQSDIIQTLTEKNAEFYKKYARFIQEGTWSSEDYYNDDLYYLDALQVAYQSSRPQVTYDIKVLRLSDTVDFSSKVFELADVAYIQDTEYFGYKDEFTPYKEKVVLTEVTSFFDSPEKDSFKVQNYLTQFDDLFQRITAATQNLEFSQGKYAKAANIMETDGTIKASVIQDTFNSNADLVYGAQNEAATIDNTGITVTSNDDGSKLVRVTSGGIFVSNDGGNTWKNAIRGDGISTDLLTAGRINTEQISIYNTDVPAFIWDSNGINAYGQIQRDSGSIEVDTTRFVRFDQYGVYGLHWEEDEPFVPTSLQDIYNNAQFGLTWEKFFLKSASSNGSVEISSDSDITVKTGAGASERNRIIIGRLGVDQYGIQDYGIVINDNDGNVIFRCDSHESQLAGWTITQDYLESKSNTSQHIRINANGDIGCYGGEAFSQTEMAYKTITKVGFSAQNLSTGRTENIPQNATIYVFNSTIGKMVVEIDVGGLFKDTSNEYSTIPSNLKPQPSNIVNFIYNNKNYQLIIPQSSNFVWNVSVDTSHQQKDINGQPTDKESNVSYTTYTYNCSFIARLNSTQIFDDINSSSTTTILSRYVPASENAWTIDSEGNAIFHNIFTDGGRIAGWYIDSERIYQTWDGTKNLGANNSNIKVELNSSGTANKNGIDYSIITDAINAAMANIGGVLMSGGLINGYNIAAVMKRANDAYTLASSANGTANSAWSKANSAQTAADDAQSSVNSLWSTYRSHQHGITGMLRYAASASGGSPTSSFWAATLNHTGTPQ